MNCCAIYTRISNNEQIGGYSIATQLEKCREYATLQNWPVVAEYVDLARSGTDDQRPEFQHMIQAALTGQFQAVIVYSFDRFRNVSGGKLKAPHWSYIFNNPFYVGVLSWNGHEYPGLHQPLVDRATFDQVQAVLRANENHVIHRAYRSFILRGLLYSLDAGSIMTGATATGKGGKYEYYRSRAKTPAGIRHHVPAEQLESQVTAVLKNVGINDNDLERMKIDEVLRLALQAAPTVGAVYKCLRSDEQRRGLLTLVVAQYGFKVRGLVITQVEPLAPFCLVNELEATKRE